MEYGFPLFDPNDEAARQEQRLREYYEEFSANARKRLLAKIVVKPVTVYDVLYPQTRELLLSKNVSFNTDLEEDAKIIRDKLIAKMVISETDLENISENFRKSLLARAKIQGDRLDLLQQGEAYRKNLIAKNSSKNNDLEKDSAQARRDNQHKNKPNPSVNNSIEENSSSYRNSELSKNVSKNQDLLRDSEAYRNQFRINDIHKNVPGTSNIEKDSVSYRNNNIQKNDLKKNIDLEKDAKAIRESSLSKNRIGPDDLEEKSEAFRKADLSKNISNEFDLLRYSEKLVNEFRKNDINKNTPSDSDIERDNAAFRRANLSKNKPEESDIEKDSEVYRSKNLSQDSKSPEAKNIDSYSELARQSNTSRNKSNESDLEQNSIVYRKDDLSLNTEKKSNLEKDSEEYRKDDLSQNKPKISNLESDSLQYRSDDLSQNKPKVSNLELDSIPFRKDDLSFNKTVVTDLEKDSIQYRKDDLSFNKSNVTNLEKDSARFRVDDLSFNKPKITDLEKDSVSFRDDDLSFNKPKTTNLETDSIPFREDDLSFNTPKLTDLEVDSVPFREDDLSLNVPKLTDLEVDSVPFREEDLSANVPNTSDLITDSTPFLYNNLSSNVPGTGDLAVDSVPFREDDLSANVPNTGNLLTDSDDFREDNISSNIPGSGNLAIDSVPFRANNIAANVPVDSNIASDSVPFREDNLSSNVPISSDLLTDSGSIRNDAMAKNQGFGLLGVNVQGAGTSAFLGISRVFTQGILVRELLLSKNRPKDTDLERDGYPFRVNNLARQVWVPQGARVGASLEYGSSNTHFDLLLGTRENTGSVSVRANYFETGSPTKRAVENQGRWLSTYKEIQYLYGNSVPNADGSIEAKTLTFSDKSFSVDTNNPKGGRFDSPITSVDQTYLYYEGYVTENMRLYNVQRNAFNIRNVQVGGLDGFSKLQSFAGDEEFQQLIASTVGSLNVRRSISTQVGTNSTPLNIIIKNGGKYFPGNGDLLRPEAEAELGSAESMMAKTVIGNPFEDEDFFAGRRGVRHIINTIKAGDSPIAKNFDPQNNRAYIAGMNRDGSPKVSRQRFTIANPYAPGQAGKLVFYLKNYSSGDQFFFPPYIQSIQNTENANWNSTNFLGRPEAIYTYNNSSRDASISFYVLTDYTQSVDIGRNWNSEQMEPINANIPNHFTQSDKVQNDARRLKAQELEKMKQEEKDKLNEINAKLEQNNAEAVALELEKPEVTPTGSSGWATQMTSSINLSKGKAQQLERKKKFEQLNNSTENAALTAERNEINKNLGNLDETIGDIDADMNRPTNYSETNNVGNNIYNLNITKKEYNNGEIICKPEDTINRINTMKEGLMFQPSYFSGDKVDFVRKVEFLSKLTRPSANEDGSDTGFSFTKPPVCHIHLGDWWNHDIIVNSVSFDYADAPWTLDGGRVQPMWVLVSINFNIIGPFKAHGARPPLSTDAGGMYSPINGITSA